MRKKALIIFLLFVTILFPQERGMRITVITQDGKSIPLYSASYALVVGISDYTMGWPDLPNALKDAREVKTALELNGFNVVLKENLNSIQLESAIKDFNASYGLNPENRLLFYFAGHGHTLKKSYGGNVGYIVPADAPVPNIDQEGFNKKAISMESYNTWARNIDAKHVLYFFDSCFSGSIFATSRAAPESITYKTSQAVRQFITAGSEDEQVPDRSIFKEQFITGIAGEADGNKDGYVTGTELGMFLQDKVVTYSRGSQHPQYGKIRDSQLDKGDFVFVVSSIQTTQPGVERPKSGNIDLSRYETESKTAADAKADWKKWQDNMESSFQKIKALDQDINLSSESKVAMWQDFLKGFAENNPYSERDEALRNEGLTKKKYWESNKFTSSMKEPTKISKDMVFIVGSTFQMGSDNGDVNEQPVHTVTLSDFYMSKYEVTVSEFREFVVATDYKTDAEKRGGAYIKTESGWIQKNDANWKNPYLEQTEQNPVTCMTWNDAIAYCNWRSQKEGLIPCYTIDGNIVLCNFQADGYRLPTEAEWEYAARGGKKSRGFTFAGSENLDDVGWFAQNSGGQSHPVGKKQANELKLLDMSGNVLEWCWDVFENYGHTSLVDPKGRDSGLSHILRGGSWYHFAVVLRCSSRSRCTPDISYHYNGFRVARTK